MSCLIIFATSFALGWLSHEKADTIREYLEEIKPYLDEASRYLWWE